MAVLNREICYIKAVLLYVYTNVNCFKAQISNDDDFRKSVILVVMGLNYLAYFLNSPAQLFYVLLCLYVRHK